MAFSRPNIHAARVFAPVPTEERESRDLSQTYCSPDVEPRPFLPLALTPSEAAQEQDDAKIVEAIDLGDRLPFAGSPDMSRMGEAIHRFLAADDPEWEEPRRLALAKRLLDAWGVAGLDPKDVATMSLRFRAFVARRWPGGVLKRETPITFRMDERTLSDRIDALVEMPEVIVVFDHKSFPGRESAWADQVKKHAGQLRLYREAIAATLPAPKPIVLALHLPISGEVLMLDVDFR